MRALCAAVVPGEYGFNCLIPAGSSPSSGNTASILILSDTDGSGSSARGPALTFFPIGTECQCW